MALVKRIAPLFLWCYAGCDTLVDQTYRGEPIATLRSVVANESDKPVENPRAAVFWARDMDSVNPEDLKEQISTSQPVQDGAYYTIHLFEEPELLIPWDARNESGPRFALGRVLIYEDKNRNAHRDDSEPLVGGLFPYAVVYAPEKLPARKGPSRINVPKGLYFSWSPLPCTPDPAPNDPACSTPVGQECLAGQSCGAGECVDRFVFPWPLGACLVPASSCVPKNGALLHGEVDRSYFAAACERDEDCGRGSPYRCDPLQGACVPYNVPRVAIGDLPPELPFCAGPMMVP